MSKTIFISANISEIGLKLLRDKGYSLDLNPKNGAMRRKDFLKTLKAKSYDAVLTSLTDQIDDEIFNVAPSVKIFANYAVGFNNFDIAEAKRHSVTLTNTPSDAVNESVAEHTFALILALTCRIVEGDKFMRAGKYKGFDPNLFVGENFVSLSRLAFGGAFRRGAGFSGAVKFSLGDAVSAGRQTRQ